MATPTPAAPAWRAVGAAGAIVSVASMVVNGLAYLIPVLAARLLPADELSVLATLLAIGAIAAVAGLGLQTAVAVRWARQDAVAGSARIAVLTAAVTAGLIILCAPVFAAALRLAPAQTVLLGLLTFPVVLAGKWLGELQGRERFQRLALGMVILAVARYGGLVGALAAGLGVTASLAAGVAGAWISVAVLRALAAARPTPASPGGSPIRGRDVIRAGTATLAMLVISYADVILARYTLPAGPAAAYAVGAVLAKGALWAPGAITVLALPRLAQGSRSALRIALACVGASGAVLVLASALLGGLAVRLVGGAAYADLAPYAAGFAAVGALYAVAFVYVNAEIAAGSRWPSAPLWLAFVGFAGLVGFRPAHDLGELLTLSVGTALAATAMMAVVYAARRRRRIRSSASEASAPTATANATT